MSPFFDRWRADAADGELRCTACGTRAFTYDAARVVESLVCPRCGGRFEVVHCSPGDEARGGRTSALMRGNRRPASF